MEPALEVEVHEGLEGAALAHELGPHALETRHDRGEGALHCRERARAPRARVGVVGEKLGEGGDRGRVEHVQAASCGSTTHTHTLVKLSEGQKGRGWDATQRTDDELDVFSGQLDAILDSGECGTEPTTVIDLSGDEPELIRQGAGEGFEW